MPDLLYKKKKTQSIWMKNEYTSLNIGKKIKSNDRSLKIYTVLYKDQIVQPKLRNSVYLKLQGMSSLLATEISALALGLVQKSRPFFVLSWTI